MLSEIHTARRRAMGLGALLVCATVIAYLPALKGGFIWDDDNVLTHNGLIRAADGLHRFWFTTEFADYWPVTSTTLWVEWRLWGMHALGYHATNLALHIGEALLLWAILRRLRVPGAWLAAFIFALHPVNVESVAWITQRKNLMAMLFFLLSIFWFLKADLASPSDPGRLHRPGAGRGYGLSLLAFALGMLSKGSVAMLPLVLLGLIAWHRRLVVRDLVRTAPFFLVAAIFAGVDVWFQRHGPAPFVRNAHFAERALGAGGIVWFYLCKALVPLNLIFVYPQWHIRSDNPLWWAPVLAAAAMTAVLWRYRRRWSRPALFAWGYFCVTLVPVLGFTDVYFMKYSLVADHYEHIAIIGPIVLVSAGLALSLGRLAPGAKATVQALVVVLVGALGVLTWRQCRMYTDSETLFRATLERNPECSMARGSLGAVLMTTDRLPEAIAQFEAALKIDPNDAEIHSDLGLALEKYPDRLPDAIAQFEAALKIRPDFAEVHYNLGNVLANVPGRLADAIAHYEAALKIKPDFAEAHDNLGNALANVPDRLADAVAQYEASLKIDPDDADVHTNEGVVLAKMPGRLPDAIIQFEAALKINPGLAEVHDDLGIVLARQNRIQEAVAQFEDALQIEPNKASIHRNLGYALRQTGRLDEARAQFEAAGRLEADH